MLQQEKSTVCLCIAIHIMLTNNFSYRRYGLLGLNGCGKSTLLTALGLRELPIPEHMDIYHLTREIEASDLSALEAVISCDEERIKLEKEVERLAAEVVCSTFIYFQPLFIIIMQQFMLSFLC